MRKRIRCIFHAESTASLVLYGNRYKCFGCGKQGNISELPVELRPKEGEIEYEEPEDLEDKFRYIKSLPRRRIRGLEFPADERGYFVCWPGDYYYKYRLHNPGKGSKYIGPKGHKPPLFTARQTGSSVVAIVEGEISALSTALAMPEWDVISPGSATQFNSSYLSRHLTDFKRYSKVIVVLDDDAAGMKGLIEAKSFFFSKIPFVSYLLIKPDCNEILETEGKEALRERLLGANYK